MATITDPEFIPELWSEEILFNYKTRTIGIKRRTRGEKLLRAAAQGASQEEIEAIEKGKDFPSTMTTGEFYAWCKQEIRPRCGGSETISDRTPTHFADSAIYTFAGGGEG